MTAPVKLTLELTDQLADDMREIALHAERNVKVEARRLLADAIRQAAAELRGRTEVRQVEDRAVPR